MKKTLLALTLMTAAAGTYADATRNVGGIELVGKSDCAAVSDQAMLEIFAQQLKSMPYAVIPPNQKGLRFNASLYCDPYEKAGGGTTVYSGEIALDVLAHVAQPFSENYWMPIFDYKIYGVKDASDIHRAFGTGVSEFLSAMRPVTKRAYQGFGLNPPVN